MLRHLGLFKSNLPQAISYRGMSATNPKIATLLNQADDCARKGKVHVAESIYKNTIEQFPEDEVAYQKLWNSWVTHRSLKVTQTELDEFIDKYSTHILLKNEPPLKFKFFTELTRLPNHDDPVITTRRIDVQVSEKRISVSAAHVGHFRRSDKALCEYRIRYGMSDDMTFANLKEKLELGVEIVNDFDEEMSTAEQNMFKPES